MEIITKNLTQIPNELSFFYTIDVLFGKILKETLQVCIHLYMEETSPLNPTLREQTF